VFRCSSGAIEFLKVRECGSPSWTRFELPISVREESGVESPSVDLIMVGNGQGLVSTILQHTADLNVTASLCEVLEPEFVEDLENVAP